MSKRLRRIIMCVQIFGTGAELPADVSQDELSRLKLNVDRREKLLSNSGAEAINRETAPL